MKPIESPVTGNSYTLEKLPPLIIGGAVFNTQYNDEPTKDEAKAVLSYGFEHGITALDTSPYYGPSEILVGDSLKELNERGKWTRNKYFICTKAGRIRLNEFDYSPKNIKESIDRSLRRLNTDYLDLVYMHDIEFVDEEQIFIALKTLKSLKEKGTIRYIGISGYPVDFLYKIALECFQGEYKDTIGALDAILSYCHGCLQNVRLFELYDSFMQNCGIKKLMNGSILSMSLLRSEETRSFHPASSALKQRVSEIATDLKEQGVELAELATRFAYKRWLFDTAKGQKNKYDLVWNQNCSIVLGVSNARELMVAISNYWIVKNNIDNINDEDVNLFQFVIDRLGPEHFNENWESGIHH